MGGYSERGAGSGGRTIKRTRGIRKKKKDTPLLPDREKGVLKPSKHDAEKTKTHNLFNWCRKSHISGLFPILTLGKSARSLFLCFLFFVYSREDSRKNKHTKKSYAISIPTAEEVPDV